MHSWAATSWVIQPLLEPLLLGSLSFLLLFEQHQWGQSHWRDHMNEHRVSIKQQDPNGTWLGEWNVTSRSRSREGSGLDFPTLLGKLLFMMWWMMLGWRAEMLWSQIKYIFSSDKLDHLLISLAVPCTSPHQGNTWFGEGGHRVVRATFSCFVFHQLYHLGSHWLNLLGSVPSSVQSINDL